MMCSAIGTAATQEELLAKTEELTNSGVKTLSIPAEKEWTHLSFPARDKSGIARGIPATISASLRCFQYPCYLKLKQLQAQYLNLNLKSSLFAPLLCCERNYPPVQ